MTLNSPRHRLLLSTLLSSAILVASAAGSAALADKCDKSSAKGTWASSNFEPNKRTTATGVCVLSVDGKGNIKDGSCTEFPKGNRYLEISGTIDVADDCKVTAALVLKHLEEGYKDRDNLRGKMTDDGNTMALLPSGILRFRKQY